MRTAPLLTISQHALPGGVPAMGTCPGVYLSWGRVYLPGGVPGVPARGVPAQVLPPCEQNHRHLQKQNLAPNFVCGR